MLAMYLTVILTGLSTLISAVDGQGIVKYFNFLCLYNRYIYIYIYATATYSIKIT